MNSLRVLLYEIPEDPYMNLAFEEAFVRVVSLKDSPSTLRIWRNRNAAVIGYFQKAEEEIKLDIARRYDVAVTRRFTGGGAVYHDLGNINYAIAVKKGKKGERSLEYVFRYLIKGIIEGIRELNVDARLENINDVVVENYKVSGTAASVKWGVYFLHGSLLVNTNLELLYNILNVSKIKLLDKGIRDIKYRVRNLKDVLKEDIDYQTIIDVITRGYSKILGLSPRFDIPSRIELEIAKALYDLKYRKEDWNMGIIKNKDLTYVEEYIRELMG